MNTRTRRLLGVLFGRRPTFPLFSNCAAVSSSSSSSTSSLSSSSLSGLFRLCTSRKSTSSTNPSPVTVQSLLNGWPGKYRLAINVVMREISEDVAFEAEAKSRHIDSRHWLNYVSTFRRMMVKEPVKALGGSELLLDLCRMLDDGHLTMNASSSHHPSELNELSSISIEEQEQKKQECKLFLFAIMIVDAEKVLAEVINAYQTLCETSDLRIPHEWYPYARLMKRKVIYHGGPTNSGKTYHALQRLKSADPAKGGGLYCGPLRLLALEVYETLNKAGVYTDLLTGQERREVPFSTHISCTVEMINLNRDYDVVVIDEIQMIGNPQRGYAWTRALLGLRAREIHVCGGLEAMNIVESLLASTGDEFELKKYERLSTLKVSTESLQGDYAKIQPGDCVVAFSRADIFSIRRQIERLTPYKCSVIYGALPPETRSTQARLFNEDNTGYDVLVASDAIGMGLNLNIKRVIFHTTIKREGGKKTYWVDPSSVKQIGGRAGRLSSAYKEGEVTAWQEADLAYIRAVMSWEIPPIPAAGIFPSVEQVELFSQQLQKTAVMTASESTTTTATGTITSIQEEPDDTVSFSSSSASFSSSIEINNVHVVNGTSVTRDDFDGGSDHDKVSGYNMNDTSRNSVEHEKDPATNPRSDPIIIPASTTTIDGSPTGPTSEKPIGLATVNHLQSSPSPTSKGSENIRLASLLERFVELSKMDGRFYLCDHQDMIVISNWLHSIPLTLAERFTFANAPVSLRDTLSTNVLYQFAATYALRRPVALNIRLSRHKPRDIIEFADLCTKHNILDLYLWLSLRFPEYFIEQDLCLEQKAHAIAMIEDSLDLPSLRQKFSHSREYQTVRQNMFDMSPDSLPPLTCGEVRSTTRDLLATIPSEAMYVFPHLREEEALANGGTSSTGSTPTGPSGATGATGRVDLNIPFNASKQGSSRGPSSGSSGGSGRKGKPTKSNQNDDESTTTKKKATVAYMVVSNPLSRDSSTSQD